MPVKNYDNSLVGEYIRAIENPDSVGWNPYLGGWMEPEGSAFDHNNRGMGIDIAYNPDALKVTQGIAHTILSEQDERNLRNAFIQDSYNYKDRRDWENGILSPISSRKEIEAMGLIYRGDGKKLYDKHTTLGKAYRSGSDEEFHQAVNDYYRKRKVSQRAVNNDAFWANQLPPYPTMTTPKTVLNTTVAERLEEQSKSAKVPWQKADGGSLRKKKWNELSMTEKAAMMDVAIKNGVYKLQDIRNAYNEFAKGGDTNEPQISDSQYYSIMEKGARDN